MAGSPPTSTHPSHLLLFLLLPSAFLIQIQNHDYHGMIRGCRKDPSTFALTFFERLCWAIGTTLLNRSLPDIEFNNIAVLQPFLSLHRVFFTLSAKTTKNPAIECNFLTPAFTRSTMHNLSCSSFQLITGQ